MTTLRLSPLLAIVVLTLSFSAFTEASEGSPAKQKHKLQQALSKTKIIEGAVGPFRSYCSGYSNPGASGLGYITVVTLHAGKITKDENNNLYTEGQNDQGLGGTVAFDRAEAADGYIGQINLIVASSFSGLNGVIWGYDVAKADEPTKEAISEKIGVDVYSIDPILDAGRRLLGTNSKDQSFASSQDLM